MGAGNSKAETIPAPPAQPADAGISNILALGAGCYWGTEKYVRKNFQSMFPGSIKDCKVGFMSPYDKNPWKKPTYKQVCTGRSGHVEVLYVELNEPEKHFEELIRFFFQFHDPTTKNRQGNDRGFQYSSYIFCGDAQQQKIAERVRDELQALVEQNAIIYAGGKKLTTLISPVKDFTVAHEAHQRYLEKNPVGYCNHRIRFKQWPQLAGQPASKVSSPQETAPGQSTNA